MVDEMINYEHFIFKPMAMRYSGSNLEAYEQYRAYLIREYNKGSAAHRPAEIRDEIKRQTLAVIKR